MAPATSTAVDSQLMTGADILVKSLVDHGVDVLFAYPGLGYLIFNSIERFDFPVIQGSVLLIVFAVALANFILDISYPLLDPRIRHQQAGVR